MRDVHLPLCPLMILVVVILSLTLHLADFFSRPALLLLIASLLLPLPLHYLLPSTSCEYGGGEVNVAFSD